MQGVAGCLDTQPALHTPAPMLLALEKGWLVRPRPFCRAQGQRARHARSSHLLRSLAAVARDSQSGSKSRDSRNSLDLLHSLLGSLDTGGRIQAKHTCLFSATACLPVLIRKGCAWYSPLQAMQRRRRTEATMKMRLRRQRSWQKHSKLGSCSAGPSLSSCLLA